MYSKEQILLLKKEFWTAFAEAYPRKWLLYNTKIKDVDFKFYVDNKKAQVALEIAPKEESKRLIYFQKIESLQTILREEFLEDAIFQYQYFLESGKEISRIWVELDSVSMNNKAHWNTIFDFFAEKMELFEHFFYEYEDYIKDLEINT